MVKECNQFQPVFNNSPVCNISRQAAELYCIWITKEFDKFNKRLKFYHTSPRYTYVRLPYRSEWCYAASNGKDNQIYPWGWDSVKNEKGSYVVNYRPFIGRYFDDGALQV
jgi:formylglycine-generating enzyme